MTIHNILNIECLFKKTSFAQRLQIEHQSVQEGESKTLNKDDVTDFI